MKAVVFSDPHINYNSIDELEKVFNEIFDIATKKKVDFVIMCGDYYDRKTPNIHAFLFGTRWAKKFKDSFGKVVFLNGNHDNVSDVSNLSYLSYMGLEIVDEYEQNGFYFGHFFTDKSPINYGKHTSLSKLKKKYKYIILGHYHDFVKLSKNAWHIGSVRYVSFGENENEKKKIAIIDFDKEKIEFIDLKSPIPIVTVNDFEKLSKIKKNTKVRIVFDDFAKYKAVVNELDKYKKKFVEFKVKLDFENNEPYLQNKNNVEQDFVENWLNSIEDKDIRQYIEGALKEVGIL